MPDWNPHGLTALWRHKQTDSANFYHSSPSHSTEHHSASFGPYVGVEPICLLWCGFFVLFFVFFVIEPLSIHEKRGITPRFVFSLMLWINTDIRVNQSDPGKQLCIPPFEPLVNQQFPQSLEFNAEPRFFKHTLSNIIRETPVSLIMNRYWHQCEKHL